MKNIKFQYCVCLHKRLIISLAIGIFLLLIIKCDCYVDISAIVINPNILGLVGTLLGAFIGGVFTLLGSVWVNKRQQKAIRNIKIKNVILSPLYDELIKIKDEDLKNNPYPRHVYFEATSIAWDSEPQYDAWRRIKLDTRYLEVPGVLKKQIEKFETEVKNYVDARYKMDYEMEKILNTMLTASGASIGIAKDLGGFVSEKILNNIEFNIFETHLVARNIDYDENMQNTINKEFLECCRLDNSTQKTREAYDNWLKEQEKTIDMLGVMIKLALLKYEG